jgi:DNA polymerase III epsilon subunit-like protein
MYTLLFLDTETTAISPHKGEIIEIAGLIVRFDPATGTVQRHSHFQTLVRPIGELTDHVTRLTGIDAEMLVSAPTLFGAQEAWVQWLESITEPIDAIVGHSISFDMSFLTHYSWFLPTHTCIDTLDISNIWCCDARAVNLEFLTHHFQLREPAAELCAQMDGVVIGAHRALYDATVCALLFERLVQRSTHSVANQWHADLIDSVFFPIRVPRYWGEHPLHAETTQIPATLLWSNTPKPLTFAENTERARSQYPSLTPIATVLQQACQGTTVPQNTQRIILAVLWAIATSERTIWFHGHGYASYWYLQQLWHILLAKKQDQTTRYTTPLLEELLIHQRQLSVIQVNSAHWLALLDITAELAGADHPCREPQEILSQLVDFFTFSLSKMGLGTFFSLQPHATDPSSQYIRERLRALNAASQSLTVSISGTPRPLLQAAFDECLHYHDLLSSILENGTCDIQLHEGGVYLEKIQPHKMQDLVGAVMVQQPTVPTFLSLSDALHTLALLKLTPLIHADLIQSPTLPTPEPIHHPLNQLWDLYDDYRDTCTLFLLSTNKSLRQAEERLTESENNERYLLFGEHGSLTKIISKIHAGFVGPVFVRMKDWNALVLSGLAPLFERVVLVELPPISIPAPLFAPHRVGDAGVLYAHRSMAAQALAGQVAHYCAQSLHIVS